MAKITQASDCSISRWNRADNSIDFIASYTYATWERHRGVRYGLDEWASATSSVENGQMMVVRKDDPHISKVDLKDLRDWNSEMLIVIPILVKERIIGIVELYKIIDDGPIPEETLQLWKNAIDQAAISLENARLFDQTQRALAAQIALRESSNVIVSALETETILSLLAEQVCDAANATSVYISEFNADKTLSKVIAEYWSAEAAPEERRSDLGKEYTNFDDEPFVSIMAKGDFDYSHIDDSEISEDEIAHMKQYGAKSILFIPILVKEQLIGFIEIWESRYVREFTSDEIRLCADISRSAAVALENARLYDETQKALDAQIAIREASNVIVSAFETSTVLSQLAEQICKFSSATSVYFCEYNETKHIYTVIADYISPDAAPEERVSDRGKVYENIDDDEFFDNMKNGLHDYSHIDDSEVDETEIAHMKQYGVKSILYIPILLKIQLIGVIEIWESRSIREFTLEEINLCKDISTSAAVALENARLYKRAQEEIVVRKKAEQVIKESLQEKEILLKEIHHRVKNNLQIISSLLNLQSDRANNQAISAFVNASQIRIRSMALIHEMLYQSENLAQVKFDEYIQKLVRHFRDISYTLKKNVLFEIDVDELYLHIDAAIPCGLILNELVSNAIEHAYPNDKQGVIQIAFFRDRHGNTLRIQDDGIGLAEQISLTNTSTLGLQLVNSLVQQINGEVSLDRSGGTKYSITFDELY